TPPPSGVLLNNLLWTRLRAKRAARGSVGVAPGGVRCGAPEAEAQSFSKSSFEVLTHFPESYALYNVINWEYGVPTKYLLWVRRTHAYPHHYVHTCLRLREPASG